MNNTTEQHLDNTQFAFQIMGILFTLIPLIVSEILPFCPCKPNGIGHALMLACANLNKRKVQSSG